MSGRRNGSQIYFRLIIQKNDTIQAWKCKSYLIGHVRMTSRSLWLKEPVFLQLEYLCHAVAGDLKQLASVNQRTSLLER